MISIIVCAYNEEKLIEQCLGSLANQDYNKSHYEVIIIDDESTDNTAVICKKFIKQLPKRSAAFRYYRIVHGGLSVARNTGVRKSKGNVIIFIDGDALAASDWLSEYSNTFHDPKCDYSSGKIELLNTEDKFAQVLQNTRFKQSFNKPFQNHFHGVNMAFRKKVFNKLGGFYENFESRGDDTSFRSITSKHFNYIPSPDSVVYHERPSSWRERFSVYKRELRLQFLVKKAVSTSGAGLHYLIPLIKSIVISTFLALGLIIRFEFIIIALVLFCFSKRSVLFKKYNNFQEWFYVLLTALIDTLLKPFYFIKSYLRYRNQPLEKPHSSPEKILFELSNELK